MTDLWNFKNEDLTTGTSGKVRVTRSGAYVFTIKEAYINKTTNSFSTACTLELENETHKVKLSIWFKGKNGDILQYNQKKLNRLMYLCKLKAEDLKVEVKKVKDYQGNDIERHFLPAFVGKKTGVFLKVSPPHAGQKYPSYNIVDFYDPITQKTCDELLTEGGAPNMFVEFNEKLNLTFQPPQEEEVSDAFPF